jgi:nitroreductase
LPVPHKPASTDSKLHELIANRWSPRSFNTEHTLTDSEIISLLEAARWSPSSMNAQPWRFLVGKRGDKNFSALVSTLKDTNTQWSPNSSAIILVAVTAENISKIEIFDAGLAVAALCLQATAMGLHTHQMGGFSKSKVKEVFSLPDNVEPVVLINVGQISDPTNLSEALKERELAPRSRKTLSELTLKGLE